MIDSNQTRDLLWSSLDIPWDIIVIGGGITGAGILSEAHRLGYKTLLVEKRDFASGTSSRSSKLVHGGLRYLRNGQLKLTYESVRERERLIDDLRSLVKPLSFVMANYQDDPFPGWVFGLGLGLYDALGLCWRHKHYDSSGILDMCQALKVDGLTGGYRYIDAITDDARLVYRLIQDAIDTGASAINYAAVPELIYDRSRKVRGVVLEDNAPPFAGRTKELHAKAVINATGVWTDNLRAQVGLNPRIRKLRGSHLVFPASRLPLARAISFLHPIDHRPVFALPWEGVTLFGTTDIDHPGLPADEPSASLEEIEYLLIGVQKLFPMLELNQNDIQATYSGLRSVIDTGKADPCKESREHVIWQENGLVTVTGGKLTTYRLMACQALSNIKRSIKQPANNYIEPSNKKSYTETTILLSSLEPHVRLRIGSRFGNNSSKVAQCASSNDLDCIPGTQTLWAELRWAARAEQVYHLDDILFRRTRLGLLLKQGGKQMMGEFRSIIQPELGWDNNRWEEESRSYFHLWETCYHCL